jgi:hypothetical protein
VNGGSIPAGGICVQTYSCLRLRRREDGCRDDFLQDSSLANAEARLDAWNGATVPSETTFDTRFLISRLSIAPPCCGLAKRHANFDYRRVTLREIISVTS